MPSANFQSEWQRALKEKTASGHQARVDAILAAAKAEAATAPKLVLKPASPLPPSLEPTEDVVEQRLSDEIDYARRLLDAVGDELTSDPMLVNRHARVLQNFDIVGQLLGHVARVLAAADKGQAIDRIGMAELKARLQRPTGGTYR